MALMQRVKLPQCHHCPCAASAMHVARQRRTPVVQGTLLDGRRACACVTPQGRLRGKAVSASSYASRKYILLLTEHMNIARLLDVARSLICLRLCSDALEHRCLVALTASAPASARLQETLRGQRHALHGTAGPRTRWWRCTAPCHAAQSRSHAVCRHIAWYCHVQGIYDGEQHTLGGH